MIEYQKNIIKNSIKKMNVDIFQYFYNQVNMEVFNNSDDNIYTFDTFNEYIKQNMFSDNVMDNLIQNIGYGNIDCNDDYIYFDVYLHLQSISFDDIKDDFIDELENEIDDKRIIKSIMEIIVNTI